MKQVKMLVNPRDRLSHINKEIYGHFTEHLGRCIYEGIYVGEDSPIPNTDGIRNDIIEALKAIKVPVIRWPGGCFADEYHWKDGIGEKSTRKKMVNTNWGGVTEDNSFGTHEFMRFCELVGAEPYISGNVGSGTVQELSEWVEYMTFDGISPMADLRKKNGREKPWKLKYLGIGNENWGCGGNMRPDYYADEYLRYQTFCRNYSGNELYKIACGPGGGGDNWLDWTDKLMSAINPNTCKAISFHYYTVPTGNWDHKGSSTEFDNDEYYKTIKSTRWIDHALTAHEEVMSRRDPEHKIGLIVDEWGCWYDVEPGTNPGFLYQQNTMRDAIVASINLNIFNRHSGRVVMANIAQMVNVLQSLILTEGAEMVKTPTYHVFDMYVPHMENELVYSCADSVKENDVEMLSYSASVNEEGNIVITASNASLTEELEVECVIPYADIKGACGRLLTAEVHSFNSFDNKENVKPTDCDITVNGTVSFRLPPCSVVSAVIETA